MCVCVCGVCVSEREPPCQLVSPVQHGSGSVGHSPDPYRREELPTSEMNGDAFSGGSQPPESREERIARHKAKAATFPAKPQSRRHRLSLQESNYYGSKPRQR